MGLRARVIAAFTMGTLLLSGFLALSTYAVVQFTLVSQREELAERQSFVNARLVRSGLRTTRVDVPQLLDSLENPTGSEAVLQHQGRWFQSDFRFSEAAIPALLRERVADGSPARMRFRVDGTTYLAIGIPVPAVNASYFEVSDISELEESLSILAVTLAAASALTTLGGWALGRWASRLVLQPVTEAATTAQSIAEGNMEARLVADGDPDLDRLVTSFNRMVDALNRRMQRDARFASDVSHELRSPLMTLASGVSVMQTRRHELPDKSKLALDLLTDEVSRFQRMVQDLLEISRTDAGGLDIVFDEVRAGEFVSRVLEAAGRDIPLDVAPDAEDVILDVDKRRMERVIVNLIENAERYAGGVTGITVGHANSRVRIAVEDAGPGVPEEERESIFERFTRGKSARARASGDGTGLGLSLVSEHVAIHKGRVWVEEREGPGARFVVELPESSCSD